MEAKTNYTLVGLAVVILAGALVAAGLWLSVGFDQKKYSTYVVYIREAVSGLSEQSAVKFNGVKVGFVSRIELNHQDPRQVEIMLSIEDGTPVTTSTTATLISQGITGTTYVGLSANSSNLTPLTAAPHQPYPVIPATPSLFNQLDKVLKEVSENVNKISKKIGEILSEENINNFHNSLANIQTFTGTMANNSQNLDHSIKNAEIFIKNITTASHQFPELVTKMEEAGTRMSATMESGKTAIDKISQQTVPPMITLMRRLDSIALNLEKVAKQMRQNPSVVIRGNTPPKPGPGE